MARIAVRTAFLTIIVAIVTTASSHAQAGYTLVRVVSPFGQAHDINNRRQVVGETGEGRAFVWHEGSFAELPLLPGGFFAAAYGINERGQIVGTGNIALDVGRAILWEDGKAIELPVPAGTVIAQAFAINNRGQVVGMIEDASGYHAVLWSGSTITDLGVPPGFAAAEALDINERGQIVGRAYATNGDVRAVLWDRGAVINLGTLPGDSFSEALAINNRGEIVGRSNDVAGQTETAFLWEKGEMRELDEASDASTRANDINSRGQVVGAVFRFPQMLASVYDRGPFEVLPGTATPSAAHAINDRGDIVGFNGGAAVWLRTP